MCLDLRVRMCALRGRVCEFAYLMVFCLVILLLMGKWWGGPNSLRALCEDRLADVEGGGPQHHHVQHVPAVARPWN